MQKRATDAHREDQLLLSVFRQLPERKLLMMADDPHFTIVDVTDSYALMVGVEREDVIGRPYFEVFPLSKKTDQNENKLIKGFRAVIRIKEPQVQQVFRHDVPDPVDHSVRVERYWRTTLYPILDKTNEVAYILQVSSNATHEIIASRKLLETRQHLESALEAGKVGSWTWDIAGDAVMVNSGLALLFGLAPEEALKSMTFTSFVNKIHPDDRERVEQAMQHSINTDTIFDTEFRILQGAEHARWVVGRGKVMKHFGTKQFSGVMVDIHERRDLQAQVELARRQDRLNRAEARLLHKRNDELQILSRSKDEFVALASHQLRTPATAVKQYLGMVLQGYAGELSKVQLEMLAKAFESNERQIQIINQILNAARADTGKLVMTPSPLEFVALVNGVVEEMRSAIESHAHQLVCDLPSESIFLMGDVGYLRMAIENLINNADKYTPENGVITVRMEQHGDEVRLHISDTGVGIAKDDLSKLFVKFSRIHNNLSIQAGGSGIGLYLAGEILRLHEGRIDVVSKLKKGTTFTIVLPILKK